MSENKKEKTRSSHKITTKELVFSAMSLALATVIAVAIKLPSLPAGGSTTLFSMFIICFVGFCYGPVTGLWCAFAYGILQFITGPYVIHPLQVLLDFPLAFGALGLSGLFYNSRHGLVKGYITGVFVRYICHSISGAIFYTTYTGNPGGDWAALVAGLAYNLTYILPEAILTLVLISLPPVNKALKKLKTMAVS